MDSADPSHATANNTPLLKHASTVSPPVPGARQPLGALSPNVLSKKTMSGSTSKRSIDGDHGHTYLKRRRVLYDLPLNENPLSAGRDSPSPKNVGHVDPEHTLEHQDQPLLNVSAPSPTEPNTPSDDGQGTQDSSAERRSFSSLINYDPSSQNQITSQPQHEPPQQVKHTSHAEILRLRLRIAMYKVRTDQVNVAFSHLREDTATGSKESSQAVEEAVAQLRREAQEVLAMSQKPIPKLMPAPVLKPTAYSSRMIYEEISPSSPAVADEEQARIFDETQSRTPRPGMNRYPYPSSPYRAAEIELTSSAVKGKVAEGLLGLRHAL